MVTRKGWRASWTRLLQDEDKAADMGLLHRQVTSEMACPVGGQRRPQAGRSEGRISASAPQSVLTSFRLFLLKRR